MTAQAGDIIKINGHAHRLACEPLNTYKKLKTCIEKKKRLRAKSILSIDTGCWRGYIAEWEITGDNLYLVEIHGCGLFGSVPVVEMQDLFPNSSGKVLAEWYSGKLYIPMGKMLKYVHGGYGTIFEKELILTIDKGKVIGSETISNE